MTEFGMTKRQHEVLTFIERYTEAHGFAPSFQEIMGECGYRSKSSVHRIIHGLMERGLVDMLGGQSRSVVLLRREAANAPG